MLIPSFSGVPTHLSPNYYLKQCVGFSITNVKMFSAKPVSCRMTEWQDLQSWRHAVGIHTNVIWLQEKPFHKVGTSTYERQPQPICPRDHSPSPKPPLQPASTACRVLDIIEFRRNRFIRHLVRDFIWSTSIYHVLAAGTPAPAMISTTLVAGRKRS